MELAFFGSSVARGVLLLLGILVAIISVVIATTSVLTARSIRERSRLQIYCLAAETISYWPKD